MTQKRKAKIYEEAKRRIELWKANSSIDVMTCWGSKLLFIMNLGLFGFCFEREKWMTNYTKFISEAEFLHVDYDRMIDQLFSELCEQYDFSQHV